MQLIIEQKQDLQLQLKQVKQEVTSAKNQPVV